jgi:anti-sigma factor RsiW
MNTHQNMEAQLWEYIDGLAAGKDKSHIEELIATNAEWRSKYEELLSFNASLHQDLEVEQPSLRFTKNVMDEIARHHIAPATRNYINKKVIYGITAFFLTIIAGSIIYAIAQVDWSAGSAGEGVFSYDFIKIDFSKAFNNQFINAFIIVNVVMGLMLLDRYLSRQKKQWHKQEGI